MPLSQRVRFGQVLWCDFPANAPAVEFHAEHPVVVVQSAKDLRDTCIVVPITSDPHNPSPTVHKLRRNYNPAAPDREVWVICSHLYTVSQTRLRPFQYKGRQYVSRMDNNDLDDVIACIRRALPQIFAAMTGAGEAMTVIERTTMETVSIETPKPED